MFPVFRYNAMSPVFHSGQVLHILERHPVRKEIGDRRHPKTVPRRGRRISPELRFASGKFAILIIFVLGICARRVRMNGPHRVGWEFPSVTRSRFQMNLSFIKAMKAWIDGKFPIPQSQPA